MVSKRIDKELGEIAKALYRVGAMDKLTYRQFDKKILGPKPKFSAKRIAALRAKCNVSQPVFADLLNVSESTVVQWEHGKKKPMGIAAKLLQVVEKHGLEILLTE